MVGPSHELNVPHFSPHPFWGRPTDYNILEHNFGVDREGHGPGKRNLKLLRVHYSSTCTCERPTICGLVLGSISFFSLASITPTNPNSEVAAREAFSHPLALVPSILLYHPGEPKKWIAKVLPSSLHVPVTLSPPYPLLHLLPPNLRSTSVDFWDFSSRYPNRKSIVYESARAFTIPTRRGT